MFIRRPKEPYHLVTCLGMEWYMYLYRNDFPRSGSFTVPAQSVGAQRSCCGQAKRKQR